MKIIARRGLARGDAFQLLSLRDKFPRGLTFYKNYTNIPAGTYAGADYAYLLNADFALGSPAAIFTSTDGNFTITSSGYQSTTANDEVLKYLIAGNRTAAQETIIIKFTPTGDFANDGVARCLMSSDTNGGETLTWKSTTGSQIQVFSNVSGGRSLTGTTVPLNGVSYVHIFTYKQTSPYLVLYLNGLKEKDDLISAGTAPTFAGTYFYIGCRQGETTQFNGVISKVLLFNRALSVSEVVAITNLM